VNSNSKRNDFQDVVRGFIIVLACLEHFGAALNTWYITTFDPSQIVNLWQNPKEVSLYLFHSSWLGHPLPVDRLMSTVCIALTPWLTHLFIALSGYNLARTSRVDHQSSYATKLKLFAFLFFLFVAENQIISPNFGMGLALFPVSVWFLILSVLLIMDVMLSLKWIMAIFLFSVFLNLTLAVQGRDLHLFNTMIEWIHPWAHGSTEPLNFFPDAILGFILGRSFGQIKGTISSKKKNILISGVIVFTLVAFYFCKDSFKIDPEMLFAYDDILFYKPSGQLFILGILTSCLILIDKFQNLRIPTFFRPLIWVSLHSLGIFFIHRIVFIKLLAPLRLHLGSYFSIPMTNSSIELLIYLGITLLVYKFVHRFKYLVNGW
jgi:hypothetical protein